MKEPISKEIENKTVMAFVDNTDFGSEGVNYKDKMQTILKTYTRLF